MANNNRNQPSFSRRDFIKAAAAVAGGTAFGGVAAAASDVTVLGNRPGTVVKGSSACDDSQDLALVNGKFLTMDDKDSILSAVAIRNGRISG